MRMFCLKLIRSRTAVFCLLLLLTSQVFAWGHIASPV
jgi:hypothetical protein